jgi:predicted nucleic acid-binding protein
LIFVFLIDTNVISEPTRKRPEPSVLAWLRSTSVDITAVSVVTVAELMWGATRATDLKRADIELWLETEFEPRYGGRQIPLTAAILQLWFELDRLARKVGVTRSSRDCLIAATALANTLTVVTRNWRDFQYTGVTVFDPWTGQTHQMDAP